jgi:uncharacterized membrane protein YdbT with pleckstrin-like domain
VPEITIQPTAKFIQLGTAVAVILFLGLEVVCVMLGAPVWVMPLPAVVMIWPAARALRRRFTKAVISGDRLRYETGILTRSTRTIQLSKLQDVRVDQRVGQRFFNVGDLSFETAGETSRLSIANVDDPQMLADDIMTRAQKAAAAS